MRFSAVPLGAVLAVGLLSACSKPEVASLVDHGDTFYGRDGLVKLSGVPGAPVEEGTYQSAVTLPVDVKDLSKSEQDGKPASPVAAVAATSWQWPVNGAITGKFGQEIGGVKNEGILIAAPEGTPIHAAQAGEVVYVGNDAKLYGNLVILRHASGDMTSYAHAKSIVVAKGNKVEAGALLGYVGHTGNVGSSALHFAMRKQGASVDPLKELPHQVASN